MTVLHVLDESVLVLIDFQPRLMPAIHEGDAVVNQALRLGRIARLLDVPVIGTEQNPEGLGENLAAVKALCSQTVIKQHFDASADGLADHLPSGRKRAIVAGCEAHVCVLQTAMGLMAHGFDVTLVADAIGSRRPLDRDTAIARLARAGAEVATVEMLAFEWLRSSRHPRFREVLAQIKA
jgi:nicotinamidase-related amidase